MKRVAVAEEDEQDVYRERLAAVRERMAMKKARQEEAEAAGVREKEELGAEVQRRINYDI